MNFFAINFRCDHCKAGTNSLNTLLVEGLVKEFKQSNGKMDTTLYIRNDHSITEIRRFIVELVNKLTEETGSCWQFDRVGKIGWGPVINGNDMGVLQAQYYLREQVLAKNENE